MTVNLSMLAGAGAQFFDNNGVILSGGLVYTYAAGTTTPQATYTTSSGSTAHTNPIVLDSAGRVPSGGEIWLTDAVAYKFLTRTSAAVLIGTYDNITGNASGVLSSLAASSGSSLVGFIQSGTGAVATTAQAKMRESISILDFGVSTSASASANATNLQKAIDATPAGGTLFIPNGTYTYNSTLLITKSITLQGSAGRQWFDNSWDLGGGSILHYTKTTGDAISVDAGTTGNVRLRFVARDLLIRGAKVSPGSATTGNGLYIQANTLSTSVHTYFDNLSICECAENGLLMEGALYGNYSSSLSLFQNGKNGLRVVGGADPIGENVWIQTRVFGNGDTGTGNYKHGVYYQPGARSNSFLTLSCSNNFGFGALFLGGGFSGDTWQFESNLGTSQLYLGSAGAGLGITSATVNGLSFSPGPGYTGKMVYVSSDASNVTFNGINFSDTLGAGGEDVRIDGAKFSIAGISAAHSLVIVPTVTDLFYEGSIPFTNRNLPAFSAKVATDIPNVTGDGTAYNIIFDTGVFGIGGTYNTATGVFTAPYTGLYLFTYVISVGDITASHTSGSIALTLTTDSVSYRIAPYNVTSSLNKSSFTGSHLVKMNGADTAKMTIQINGGTKVVDILANESWFTCNTVTTTG